MENEEGRIEEFRTLGKGPPMLAMKNANRTKRIELWLCVDRGSCCWCYVLTIDEGRTKRECQEMGGRD